MNIKAKTSLTIYYFYENTKAIIPINYWISGAALPATRGS